ncbi:cytoskeleton-associated protein 2-like [Salvelinus fontinalis]|uniref:cytoskeleton-associated protein 2-like n=1 Tax=Salvelinus fontinalis TaxID=8038 RepID=UPI002486B0D1|nr:cytoskeleton-associated protein 2-like [Salvelinus fontinalis]
MSQVTRLQIEMDAEEMVAQLNRKELRKQQLIEYLAAKGRLKPPNPKPYLRDAVKAKQITMSTVKDDLDPGKENQGPNPLKMKKGTVKVQPLMANAVSQTTGTFCSTTNKQISANGLLSAASSTARLNVLKGLTKPSAVAPSHSTSLKTAPDRSQSTVPTKRCPGTTNQPRTQPNLAVKVSNTRPSSAKPLANAGRTHSANTTRPKPNITGKPANTLRTASTRPNTASTRPNTASTRPNTASTRPNTASTRPNTASTRPNTASTRPNTASTRPNTASTRPNTASTRPNTASTRPNTASTRPNTASTRPNTASTRPNTASTRPNTASTRPNTASTRPNTASSARMSPSTMVKTKTGLVSVQMQPRSTTVPAPASASFTPLALNRACPSTSPVPAVTQKPPVTAQRRRNPFTGVSETNQRTTALAVDNGQRRSQAVSRTDSTPLPERSSKPAGQRQPVTGPKPIIQGPTGPGHKTAATKPGNKRTTKTSPRVSIQEVECIQRAASQHRAEARGAGASTRIWKAASRASTGITGNQWQNTALSRAMHAAVAAMGQKSSSEENRGMVESGWADTDTKNEPNAPSPSSTSPACWPRPHSSTVNGVWLPQTVPRSAKKSSHGQEEVGWEAGVGLKTPRDQARVVPKTEGRRKMTVAQEERMQKLQEWRENRGISYKRPPMPVRPPRVRRTLALPQAYWDGMEEEVEARCLVEAVDRCLADCIKLLNEGCLSSQVQEMLSTVPMAEKFSKYWICQARLMERQGNLEVLPLFEEAVRVVLEPVDELRTVVFEMLKKKEDTQGQSTVASEQEPVREQDDVMELHSTPDPMATPTAVKALIRGDRGGSSVVKYKITATPGGFRSQKREAAVARVLDGQELRFFTPVRRSVRIEKSALCYPASLQEHDLCVASFNDLMAQQDEREGEGEREGDEEGGGSAGPVPNGHLYVYRENGALRDKVNIQLVYAEEED